MPDVTDPNLPVPPPQQPASGNLPTDPASGNATMPTPPVPPVPLTPEQQIAAMQQTIDALTERCRVAFDGVDARFSQAGGVMHQAARWSQQAESTLGRLTNWAAAAQQAGQTIPALPTSSGSVKPPLPSKFRGPYKEPKLLEWTHQVSQYLMAVGLADSVQGVFHVGAGFLADEAATWWRLHCDRVERGDMPPPVTWWALRALMLEQFTETNRLTNVQDAFDRVRQKSSVTKYIAEFQAIVLELPEVNEMQRVHRFIRGLKRQVQVHVWAHAPVTLAHAMRVADSIDQAMYNSQGGAPSGGFHGSRNGQASSGAGQGDRQNAEPMQLNAAGGLSLADQNRCLRDGLCFKCMEPGHQARNCKSSGKGSGRKGAGSKRRAKPPQGN